MNPIIRRVLIGVFCFTAVPLFADTDEILDTIYGEKEAPLVQSTWLILAGAGVLEESSGAEAAMAYLEEKGWEGESVLTKGKLSVLFMENFDIPAGLMYRITGWEHYAVKDLAYLNILGGRADKEAPVTGFDLVNSLAAVLEES